MNDAPPAPAVDGIDWAVPWLAPWRKVGERVARDAASGGIVDALNAEVGRSAGPNGTPRPDGVASASGMHDARASAPRFVPQSDLPAGDPYETFIRRTGHVPTRENLHDLFNGLAWLHFPALKWRLNQWQSDRIARDGVNGRRGALRDALTLFDENAALWQAPTVLVDALLRRDWPALFIEHRGLWARARLTLFGHALLEKLTAPRKGITAHVWVLETWDDTHRPIEAGPAPADSDACARWLTPERLAARSHLALPVLGVPGWWAPNDAPGFYADAAVFRPALANSEDAEAKKKTAV